MLENLVFKEENVKVTISKVPLRGGASKYPEGLDLGGVIFK
jgi:hypothetical protein